ncbi:MAG: hypothetical protein K5870_00145 [Lachnospiraceae bacterium]|nr:hypothetical protein [Lachnospiraceae bacterium]
MKKTPLIIALISSAILLELLAVAGYNNIYAMQKFDPVKEPVFSKVFTAINDGIYPWDIFNAQKRSEEAKEAEDLREKEEAMKSKDQSGKIENEVLNVEDINVGNSDDLNPSPSASPTPTATPSPTPGPKYPQGRLEPLRESTYDEYINHISADIYGDTGVLRAAEYEFKKVGIEFFDDALFIGDSRTVGLRDYTELKDHADFLCETSLTIKKVFTSDFKGKGTVEKALAAKDYGKIYIMVGVNELGTGTTEDFIEDYANVVDTLHELEPEAKIIIMSIMNIDREKSTSDKIFNNSNILGRNNAIATLADNETIFYININEAVCDEDGFLRDDLRGDHLHLLGASNEIVVEYLKEHGV